VDLARPLIPGTVSRAMEEPVQRIGPTGDKYAFKCSLPGADPIEVHVHARIADAIALPGEDLEASVESGLRMLVRRQPEFLTLEALKLPRGSLRVLRIHPEDRGFVRALRRAKGLKAE
jgi:hypothetical protein